MEKQKITITLVYNGKEYVIDTYKNQYFSLMSLISENLGVPGFGICSGMGSCGTCIVNIYRKDSSNKRSSLSCGIPIDDELADMTVEVID